MIAVDVTTRCHLNCAHCTRGLRHLPAREDSSLTFIERALASLKGWPGAVGCIGGEPTLHRDFPEACRLFRRFFPRWKCGLWTAGGPRFEKHRALIDETFQIINYNDHTIPAMHHPIFVAGEDILPDPEKRRRCIDRCWLRHLWSPAITEQGGAYFCEVASAIDHVLGLELGWPVEEDWWNRNGIGDQRSLCEHCGIPYRLFPSADTSAEETISARMEARLRERGSPVVLDGAFTLVGERDHESALKGPGRWEPYKYAPKGRNYWTRRSWRVLVRKKALAAPYRFRKAIWDLRERFGF
jgi:hypothetical protein